MSSIGRANVERNRSGFGFPTTSSRKKGWSSSTHARQLIGQEASPAQITKLIAWILDTADAADGEVNALDVDQEMKDGILHVTGKLREAFDVPNVNNDLRSYFPAMPQTIGILKSFLKVTHLEHSHRPELAADLLSEIEEVLGSEAFAALDPKMAEIARRHLRLLTITLNHLDAFGVEAAMIAYSELIVRLQGAMGNATPAERATAEGIVKKLGKWWEKLKQLNEAYEAGTKLVENASEIGSLLGIK